MPSSPPTFRPDRTHGALVQHADGRESSAARGYGRRWRAARARYLRSHPLCVECEREGMLVPAEVVDHVTPHKGNYARMWDQGNWQALCKACHDRKTANEDGGFGRGNTRAY